MTTTTTSVRKRNLSKSRRIFGQITPKWYQNDQKIFRNKLMCFPATKEQEKTFNFRKNTDAEKKANLSPKGREAMPVRHFRPLFKPTTRRNKTRCENNESRAPAVVSGRL